VSECLSLRNSSPGTDLIFGPFTLSRTVLGPIQPSIQRALGNISLRLNQTVRDGDHSSSAVEDPLNLSSKASARISTREWLHFWRIEAKDSHSVWPLLAVSWAPLCHVMPGISILTVFVVFVRDGTGNLTVMTMILIIVIPSICLPV
jgi:hypothetical protein